MESSHVESYLSRTDDIWTSAWALNRLGWLARETGDLNIARARLEQSLQVYRHLGDPVGISWSAITLGEVYIALEELRLAAAVLAEGLELARTQNETDAVGWGLNHLGHLAQARGEAEEARALHSESLTLFTVQDNRNGLAWAHHGLGEVAIAMGNAPCARVELLEAAGRFRALRDRVGFAWVLGALACVAALESILRWRGMPLSIDLSGGRALVTGASSGIGLGMAQAFAQAGCDVAGCGLEASDSEGTREFIARVEQQGRRAFFRRVDLIDAIATRAFVEWAAGQLGGIDFVISNAGANYNLGVEATTEAVWHENFEVNLAAHWRIMQAAKPYLDRAQAPVVIINASNQAFRSAARAFPYNVAKAALPGMVQSLALEWGPHVRAVGIAPGYIDTPMNIRFFNLFPDPAARRALVERIHPVGRMGTPEEVGALCAYLCSPLAGFISGTTILIDGGRSAVMQDV
jgi:NAD(P)-dependent dehydrogenase (short-subunit alcohol dehydrogenase family)